MLILKHLTIRDSKHHTLINDLNYSLGNDDKVGIIGEEGNGKSTLLKAVYNRNLIEDYATVSGEIDTDYKEIGYFEQQLSSQWEDAFLFDYLLKEKSEDEIQPERYNDLQGCETLCAQLGLKNELLYGEQRIGTLSGGEKVKLQLLKLMLRKPKLLLLDEPTNDLDIQTLTILEDYLDHFDGIILIVSHDRYFLDRTVSRIFAFNGGGKIRQSEGGYSDYLIRVELEKPKDGQTIAENMSDAASAQTGESDSKKTWKQREKKLKFSYKEQREYETIDEDIAKLEEKIEKLDREMVKNATNSVKLREIMADKEAAEKQLEEKMDRWVYLNDLAERIEAQKNNG